MLKNELIECLHAGHHSLVVDKGGIRSFSGRGVADLYRLLTEEAGFLYHAVVADKVIGKAAAALLVVSQVGEVYADVISVPACELFKQAGIPVTYGEQVPHIINRSRTGWCPLEIRCHPCRTAEECVAEIKEFMKGNKTNQTNTIK